MQVKRRRAKKVAPKAFRKVGRRSSSLEELATAKMPKWRVVEDSAADNAARPEADAVSPKLSGLQSSISSGSSSSSKRSLSKDSASVEDSEKSSGKGRRTGLVVMAPNSAEDAAKVGTKTQVFEDDEHTGAQG